MGLKELCLLITKQFPNLRISGTADFEDYRYVKSLSSYKSALVLIVVLFRTILPTLIALQMV